MEYLSFTVVVLGSINDIHWVGDDVGCVVGVLDGLLVGRVVGDTVGPGDYDPQLCRNKSAINFGKVSTRKWSKKEII